MVKNPTFKNYSSQIAELFCSESPNKVLCKASIAERLNTFLDDTIYPAFLAKLSEGGRLYITTLEAFQNKGFRIVLVDLITGERATAWWDISYNMPYYSKLPGKLNSHGFYIISNNRTFDAVNRSDFRITHHALKPGYGITFVPFTPPGTTPPPPGTTPPPPGSPPGTITKKPVDAPSKPVEEILAGFDMQTILLIGGLGIAAWFLLKK